MHKSVNYLHSIILLATCSLGFASSVSPFDHPFYAGVSGGYGSTTWRGLVPTNDKQNAALSISTPVEVKEGGAVFGIFTGYEFTPYFALEASFRKYPRAHVTFEDDSLFTFDHDERNSFRTDTDTISLMAKIMLVIPKSTLRFFSSVGVAGLQRLDEDHEQMLLTPTFGAGFNLSLTERFMLEMGFNYTAGYGESELSPAKHYIPFLYSGTINLAYRF